VPACFCRPHAHWQRGSNEITNGLLRQHFPRSTDFRALTQSDFDNVAAELSGRPRQTLGWKSPCQALDEALQLRLRPRGDLCEPCSGLMPDPAADLCSVTYR
jgi:IS30 family transposase